MSNSKVVPVPNKSNISWLPRLSGYGEPEHKITQGAAKQFETMFSKIVFCLRIIGIPLNPAGIREQSRLLQCWSLGLGCFIFFSSISLNIYAISQREKPMTTSYLSNLIDEINLTFALIMVLAGLLFRTSFRWSKLASILNLIETVDFFRPEDFKKFSKICVFGGCAMLLMPVFTSAAGLVFAIFPSDVILPIRVVLFTPHLSIGCGLCQIISFIVVTMLRILSQRIGEIDKIGDPQRNLSLVLQWQRCYHLIYGLVNEINRSFGIIVLVMIVFEFIWMVNTFFITALEFKTMGQVQLSTLITNLLLTVTACCVTSLISVLHDIKQAALELAYQIRMVYLDDPIVHQKVHELMLEISVSPPEITMLGLADVDLRLIPTVYRALKHPINYYNTSVFLCYAQLIWTTLTYIIILMQFQHNEGDRAL